MRVTVNFVGVLASFVGAKEVALDLPQGACYEDLLAEIGRVFGPNMPAQLWNQEEKVLNASVRATRDERSLTSIDNSELVEGDEIKLFLMAAGG